jgi:ABC-type sugar transport system ATPase subunit
MRLAGRTVAWRSPREARDAGIAVIHQEQSLVPGLTAAENMFLGREPVRRGLVCRGEEQRRAREFLARLGATVDVGVPCGRLTTAQRQLVEIARAIASDARIVVMDEPTAALSPAEAGRLHDVVRELKARGVAVIYISHRLEEVAAVCDRVVVLRDGRHVGGGPVAAFDRRRLIALMVGRDLADEYPARSVAIGPVRLEVRGLSRGRAVRDVSFTVRQGEIVALAGLVGAGRTETLRLVAGADQRDAGAILLDGRPLAVRSPRDAIARGIALLSEDRKAEGLVLPHPVRENIALPNLAALAPAGFIDAARERALVGRFVARLGIRLPHADVPAGTLSGGNQQKVVIAKWLARGSEVLLFDEPTRGIDVAARREIYLVMNELVAAGKSLVIASSDLPEVLGMADRIVVMRAGRVAGELDNGPDVTPERVMALAVA